MELIRRSGSLNSIIPILASQMMVENEQRPYALTNDEVILPMAALGSAVDSLGPLVDGDAILDCVVRRSRFCDDA